jgi:DNA modification methylase
MPSVIDTLTDPTTQVISGDCREVISDNLSIWADKFAFVFADPPFNIGHGYDVYLDRLDDTEFAQFTAQWIAYVCHLPRENGLVAIHVPDEMVGIVLQTCEALGFSRIEWLIWHYRFGQAGSVESRGKFIRSKNHCLIFRRGDGLHTFNGADILVPSDRATKYNDARTFGSETPGLRIPLDVICNENNGAYFSRVPGNSAERLPNHPNQLPERYLQLLISAFTNPGDWIFDPFCGTGTTAVVARALGRNCITCDVSETYCKDAAGRCRIGAIRVEARE